MAEDPYAGLATFTKPAPKAAAPRPPSLRQRKVETDIGQSAASAAASAASAGKTALEAKYLPRKAESDIAKATMDVATAAEQLPFASKKASAEARKAEAEAKRLEEQAKFNGLSPEVWAAARGRLSTIQALEKLAAEQARDYNAYFKGQGVYSPRELLPDFMSPVNQRFNKRADQMQPLVGALLGMGAKQLDTPKEVERLRSFLPQAGLTFDASNEQRIANLQDMINTEKSKVLATIGQKPQGARPPLSSFFEKKK